MINATYPKVEVVESDVKRLSVSNGCAGYEATSVNGILFPVFYIEHGIIPDPRQNMQQIHEMVIRNDDVIICAYLKTGTHWVWEIISMLNKGAAEYEKLPKEMFMLEFRAPEDIDKLPSPRILNTHMLHNNLPRGVTKNGNKIIFIQRNPKDVAVSLYHHLSDTPMNYKPTWGEFLAHFQSEEVFISSWSNHLTNWEKDLKTIPKENVLILYFEDLKQDPLAEVKRIAAFLGHSSQDEHIYRDIAEKCCFSKLKEAKLKPTGDPEVDEDRKRKGRRMYRKGEVGDWKNYFTVAQNEEFDKFLENILKNSKFKYTYE